MKGLKVLLFLCCWLCRPKLSDRKLTKNTFVPLPELWQNNLARLQHHCMTDTATIKKFRGAYAVTGNIIQDIVQNKENCSENVMKSVKPLADSSCPHHVTFCSKTEAALLSESVMNEMRKAEIVASDMISFGVHLDQARHNAFVKLLWSKGNLMRIKYGLKPKDFHITLSSLHLNDDGVSHEISNQDVISLMTKQNLTERHADHFLYDLIHVKHNMPEQSG